MHLKDFDNWNVKKKQINDRGKKPPLFKERDIWWVSIGVNVGFEEDGKHENFARPVLIIKKYNRDLFLGIPLSTKTKNNKYYVPITLKGKTVAALISQLRSISSKRIMNKLGELDEADFDTVREKVKENLFLPPSLNEKGSRG